MCEFQGYDLKVLTLGVSLGSVLLIPKMAALLMEGLIPLVMLLSEFIQKHFKSRGKIYIGLDSAVVLRHPVMTMADYLFLYHYYFLAVVLPGNTVYHLRT